MITFRCKNCSKKVSVDDMHDGKRIKCPQCGQICVIPDPAAESMNSALKDLSDSRIQLQDLVLDTDLENDTAGPKEEPSDVQTEQPEQKPRRKLPWVIDIFLYPTSSAGLTNIGIVIGTPILLGVIMLLLGPFGLALGLPALIINTVVRAYLYYYIADCVRDSAKGGIRAPEIFTAGPDFGDIKSQMLEIIGCLLFFLGPVFFYSIFTHKTDVIFQVLLGYAIFFFPMGLLAVIMFGSLTALNPLLLIPSIFSAFFQYCGLVLLFCGIVFITQFALRAEESQIINVFAFCTLPYLMMVEAHLLGRFYWKYQEKLNWEV